ncbi:MAG: zinc ABC transporter substrate-binding protein [Rubellimicrobium sp.]|nr:zinc ABC transporter substrate-binding protein [Rubellimicrobium sp.]
MRRPLPDPAPAPAPGQAPSQAPSQARIRTLSPTLRPGATLALLLAPAALTAAPATVTDIAPVHALVAQVMGDVGTPAMLLAPGASLHDTGLRPSGAAALETADLVIWSGPQAVPHLAAPIATLAGEARILALLDSGGWTPLPLRTDPDFAGGQGDDHDHGDAETPGAAIDPHAWLDPGVAMAWLDTIAAALAETDPENAATYRANAERAQADLAQIRDRIADRLGPVAGRRWIAAHDAYGYFERAFAVPAAGAIALSDAADPGPAHVAELRAQIAEGDIACILADPATSPRLLALLTEGGNVRAATADPDGIGLEPGPALLGALLTGIATALGDCLGA